MNNKYRFWGAFAALMLLLSTSCSRESGMVLAIVEDSGNITDEGCGYLLKLENGEAIVKPEYLPAAYQHNEMRVKVRYEHLHIEDTCKAGTVIYDRVKINEIVQNVERK